MPELASQVGGFMHDDAISATQDRMATHCVPDVLFYLTPSLYARGVGQKSLQKLHCFWDI